MHRLSKIQKIFWVKSKLLAPCLNIRCKLKKSLKNWKKKSSSTAFKQFFWSINSCLFLSIVLYKKKFLFNYFKNYFHCIFFKYYESSFFLLFIDNFSKLTFKNFSLKHDKSYVKFLQLLINLLLEICYLFTIKFLQSRL